jgi:peptidoglycan/xylan/chitin deacetylase (PgdA/CDA1 family)
VVGEQEELPYLDGLYHIPSEKQFTEDLDILLKHYKPIDLKQLHNYNLNKELPSKGKFFFLSFDDGLKQCVDIVAPILKKKGIPATFFVNTAFIDNVEFMHRFKIVLLSKEVKADKSNVLKNKVEQFFQQEFTCRYKAAKHLFSVRFPQKDILEKLIDACETPVIEKLKKMAPYMSLVDLKNLQKAGHTIGAHSHEHPEFYLISEKEQLEQAKKSIELVNQWLSPEIQTFAFPFTDNGVLTNFFNNLNQESGVDLTFASAGLKKDKIRNHIHRISMDDYGFSAEQRLKTEYLYYLLKKPLGKNTMKRQ